MDHDWEGLPLIIDNLSEFEYDNILSLKRCRNCGLEIVNTQIQ